MPVPILSSAHLSHTEKGTVCSMNLEKFMLYRYSAASSVHRGRVRATSEVKRLFQSRIGSKNLLLFAFGGLHHHCLCFSPKTTPPPIAALAVGLSSALSFYSFLHISDTLYAELPFAFVTTLFLVFHRRDSTPASTVLDGLLGAAAYLLRTAGLALLVAWVAESLLRRRFREAVLRAVISAIPILLWQTYIWRVTHSDEYRHPVYSYQRARSYYTNVTYGRKQ